MTGHSQMVLYGLQVNADRYSCKQVCAKLWSFGFWDSFEDSISQPGKPFWPTQFDGESGMVVVVQCAADETTATILKACALNNFIGCAVRSHLGWSWWTRAER